MADLPTPQELAARGQGVFRTALDPAGTGAVDLRPGSRNDTLLSVLVALATRNLRYAANRFAAAWLSSAEEEDLDVLARDLFSEERKAPAPAKGTVYLSRAGSAATSIPKGSRFGVPGSTSQKAVAFQAAEDVAVTAGTTKTKVPVKCTEGGEAGDVQLSAITAILDPLPDTGWSLYVPTAGDPYYPPDLIGGGAKKEADNVLRERLRQIAVDDARQRGTRRALLAGALRVPGVRFATVVEPLDGTVIVYAGDAGYGLPSALKSAIETELTNWRAFGVPALVRAYNATTVTVTGTVYMARALTTYDIGAVRSAAVREVKRYFEELRPQPDEYHLNAIEAALFRAHDDVQDVALSAPASSVLRPPDTGYGAVTSLNRYRVTDASVSITIAGPRTS